MPKALNVPPNPPPTRRSGGSDSVITTAESTNSTAPIPVSTQNTVRQVPTTSTCPPITGARIGANPLIVAIAEKYAAATFPANMSATTARPTTIPAAPAAPCRKRTAISTVIDVVSAQTALVSTNSPTPTSSGSRRPTLSDSGPVIN